MCKMKKVLTVITGLLIATISWSQPYIHGSIQQGSTNSKVDIVFNPEFTNPGGGAQYITFMQFGIAVPATGNGSLTATFTPAAAFSGLTFTPQAAYNFGGERIYNWVCVNPGSVTNMSWTSGTPFPVGAVTFASGGAPAKVRLVDLTNQGGDGNTFFVITINVGNDPTEYGNQFYAIGGGNGSTLGNYPLNDKYVETNLLISLPVNLLNFSGYKNGSKNTLNWTVASEVNNRGFEVQRSTDGVNYSAIGFVNSQVGGYTNSEVRYTFDDNNPAGKRQYYRLNQKDIDGNSKLSNIVVLSRDKPTELSIGGLFPNPASTKVNVIIDAPGRDKVTVVVTDMLGKIVKQQQENVDTGSNTVGIDIANLAGGSYLVKLRCQSSDCETAAAKFNKQ